MNIKKPGFIIYFLLSFPFFALTQEEALKSILKEDMKRHLVFISSDSLQGRSFETDFPGLEITAAYLKKVIEETGLKPGLPGYSQKVEILKKELDLEGIFIQVNNKKGNRVYRSGEIISLDQQLNSVDLKGKTVFAGFGWNDPVSGYDDFAGIDVKDKIVFIAEGTPETFNKEGKPADRRLENQKSERAFNAGARAVVSVSLSQKQGSNSLNNLLKMSNQKSYELVNPDKVKSRNYFSASPEVAGKILGGKNKYEKYISKIVEKRRPDSFDVIGKETEISFIINENLINTENIIGIVEGSDPQLKDEYVVYMAHYDHLGIAENGDVYNGADDNGSGVVTLLALAKAFSELDHKPKRSIVFLWVTGEEPGMFGSDYYSRHPVFPMAKTVACINLDMTGRVYEPRDSVWNHSPKLVKDFDGIFTLTNDVWPELRHISNSNCEKLGLIPDNSLHANFLRSSDHYHFHKNGVPILNVATGYHADYHKPTDEISKISFDKMKLVADFVFLVGFEVANSQKIKSASQ